MPSTRSRRPYLSNKTYRGNDGLSELSRFRQRDLAPPSGTGSNLRRAATGLFMLVSALMGLDKMKEAYAHAIDNGYRFYSYGDASLLLP